MKRLAAGLVLGSFFFLAPASGDDKESRLKPTNLEQLNSKADEDDPHVHSTGQTLLYTYTEKGKSSVLAAARRPSDKAWLKGKPMIELQGKADYKSVFLTPEGRFPQLMYYATNKNPETGNRGDNYDIYFRFKQFANADFTNETALRSCTAADELHPWQTADGQALYFSRKDKDGWRLYVARRPGGGQFGDAENVGLPEGFHHATVSPSGKEMYLQGPLEKDRWGLFKTTYAGKGWNKPEPLTALNDPEAPTGDRSPCLSRDGAVLYFASDRAGGKGGLDLWAIPVAEIDKKKK